ncbi:transporter [Maridesulfovibrio sp.]|uniref:transporter n=1 Tax=Maridesulfovibrio sp. TaxID=2795000 RepID=UPI002A18B5AB|nr:transporter [Maridesulfovibrio sp.]
MKRILIAFIFVFCLAVEPVLADSVIMKNGDKITGDLITFHGGICIFNTIYGSTARIESKDIAVVTTDNEFNIEFKSGEKIIGTLQHDGDGGNIALTKGFGHIRLQPDSIVSMSRNFPNAKNDSGDDSKEKNDSFGEEQEKEPPLDFLTGTTVLLQPGQMELETGISYKYSRTSYSMMQVGYFQRAAHTARMLQLDATFRVGVMEDMEAWLNVPFTYTSVDDVSTNEFTRSDSKAGLGDISFGGQYLLVRESENTPSIAATLSVGIPTGEKRYYEPSSTWKDPLNNSSGHWRITPGVSVVQTLDPAIVYGGVNLNYALPDTIDGYKLNPVGGFPVMPG